MTMKPDGWMAVLETQNFVFRGFGTDQDAAVSNLSCGWLRHRRQYGFRNVVTFAEACEEFGEPQLEAFHFGQCHRDGEPIE